jgi:hypothetical protein
MMKRSLRMLTVLMLSLVCFGATGTVLTHAASINDTANVAHASSDEGAAKTEQFYVWLGDRVKLPCRVCR